MITLDQLQIIPAETTFRSLEVTKKLEVNGTIAGRQLNDFLPNPTLEETKEVSAACTFRELIVQGTITIEGSLNGQNLESLLADVVYETSDGSDVVITAPKTFTDLEVNGDIEIASNFIDNINLDDIMMADRDQVVNFNILSGNVFFSNLKLSGLFDGINATELERNSFRTFGDQFIETPIIIGEGHRIEARSADIKDSLNRIPTSDFMFIDQPVDLASIKEVIFDELHVETLKLAGDVVGSGAFTSLNLSDLSTNIMSKSRTQKILVPVKIKSLITNGTFHAKAINGIDFDEFIKYMRGIKNFKSLILSGEQRLDNLIINGNVNLKSVNGRDFNEIVQNAIWLNRPNSIGDNLKFLDDVVINGQLTVQDVNKKSFQTWIDNWISNQESSIKIQSNKAFSSDVIVDEALETETINDIKFENLLMKKDVVELSNLNIHGNVNVDKLFVERSFNDKPVKALQELYSYDALTDTHTVNSDVHFNQPAVVDYLNTPVFNQVNVSKWMANLIRTDESNVYINSDKIFSNDIVTQQGFFADTINNIKMDFLDKVVLVNEPSLVNIESDLIFTGDVYAQLIGVKGDLYTRFISNCDIKEWIHHALPIDRDLVLNGRLPK